MCENKCSHIKYLANQTDICANKNESRFLMYISNTKYLRELITLCFGISHVYVPAPQTSVRCGLPFS